MLKFLSRLKKSSGDDEEVDRNRILDELERSYSSIQSLNSARLPVDNERAERSQSPDSNFINIVKNDQFQSLQLAEMLEKMAIELRIYCKQRTEVPQTR